MNEQDKIMKIKKVNFLHAIQIYKSEGYTSGQRKDKRAKIKLTEKKVTCLVHDRKFVVQKQPPRILMVNFHIYIHTQYSTSQIIQLCKQKN